MMYLIHVLHGLLVKMILAADHMKVAPVIEPKKRGDKSKQTENEFPRRKSCVTHSKINTDKRSENIH